MSINDYLVASEHLLATARKYAGVQKCDEAVDVITKALGTGRPLLVCGNGGSASDAMHITGELVGRFLKERRALNCICLSSNSSVLTAWSNDYEYASVFARQVEAYGTEGGVVLGLSTSGNSDNVVRAFETAQKIGMNTVGVTGKGGGLMAEVSDILIDVPSSSTPLIQQVHICLYHYICEHIETRLAPGA